MKASTAILIAMLVVIIALIFYAVAKDPSWVRKSYWLANFVESPWEVYRRSDGTFDGAARLALQRATSRTNPTPAENLLAATVITRNILGQEHRPERTPAGVPTPRAVEQARLRRTMFDQARGHYMAALDGLHPARQAAPRATLLNQETEMILAAAAEFAFGGIDGLLANDAVLAAMLAEDWDFRTPFTLFQGGPPFIIDQPLANRVGQLREEVVETRRTVAREAAAEQGGARGAAVDAYVTLATQNTNDLQNSHDTGVLACLKAVVARLRADQGSLSALPTVDKVIADIQQVGDALSEGRPPLVADAVAVAERTKAGNRVIALDVSDEECLRRVWHRADDPRNSVTRAQIRQAVFDNLVDAWEEGIGGRNIACVNGRTTRILSALVLLDWDKRNWDVKRLEQFKNDIFDRAHAVIMSEAAAAAASDDPDRQKAGKLYLAKTAEALRAVGPVPDSVTERLAQEMRDAISRMVDSYVDELENDLGAKGAIPGPQIEMTKMEAMAAVG
jgi:hypothetical protein